MVPKRLMEAGRPLSRKASGREAPRKGDDFLEEMTLIHRQKEVDQNFLVHGFCVLVWYTNHTSIDTVLAWVDPVLKRR